MIARVCTAHDEEGARFAGFASAPEGADCVIFSITLEPDEQDRRLKLDGLHIEINGEGNGGYEKVLRVVSASAGLAVYSRAPGDPLRISFGATAHPDEAVAALRSICDLAGVPFEQAPA